MSETPDTPPIEIWEIAAIKPYAANAKIHEPAQIDKLAAAIKSFGWTQPIVVWVDGTIIAGHGRRLAAIKLGLKKVPVIVRRDLSKLQADALRLADNRVVSTAYDQAAVQEELRAINDQLLADADASFSMLDLGYDERELDFSITDDLGSMDEDLFVEDITEAVSEHKKKTSSAVAETDDIAAPVADALGFKRVTIAESRAIRGWMSKIEAQTGKSGAEALLAYISATA